MSPKMKLFSKFSTIDPKEIHYKTKHRCLSAHVHKTNTGRNQQQLYNAHKIQKNKPVKLEVKGNIKKP